MPDNPENENKTKSVSLPVIVTRGLLIFPNGSETISVGREFGKAAVDDSRRSCNSLVYIAAQKDPAIENPSEKDVYPYGTLCRITNLVEEEDGYRIRVVGSKRASLHNYRMVGKAYYVDGVVIDDVHGDPAEEKELVDRIVKGLEESPAVGREIPRVALNQVTQGAQPEQVVDHLVAYLPIASLSDKANLLGEPSVIKRLQYFLAILGREKQSADIEKTLNDKMRSQAEKNQRDYILREKMKAIQDELGEGKDKEDSPDAIKEELEKNPYPENVKARVRKELKRYAMMPETSVEASLIMDYIHTLMNVPWYQKTEDNEDLDNVKKVLDEDHYGLEPVKKRIVEYLAVKKMTGTLKAPILCFYGPPGCGKTSLGRSIARALGRKFYKASLGGIYDEAEIRGHRRTYVGAMPGRIIQGMTKAGVTNPVFMLDEIDKLGSNELHGDPASALLEVLDPEQNFAFADTYLEEPYDLSNVLFIATANYLENVPAPLRDRLELIEVPSYTELEKVKISAGFLVKKETAANGLKPEDIEFTEDGIKEIIEHYTLEAGVRWLERNIATCCRKAVVQILQDKSVKRPIVVDAAKAREYLGKEILLGTQKEKENQVGVVTGLAYTEAGGDILPIEVTYFPGKGGLVLTGSLGDVMKESCSIAIDYVRANAQKYGIDPTLFEKNDFHIHVPEGATPKDGPSAGVAITTAIVSACTHTPVDANVAMTGEVTLRGKALAIGGLREKSLAALRSGIKQIIVPKENERDVAELPEEVKNNLKISYMTCVDDALAIALVHPKA